jgi:hypothetical protein
VNPLTEEIDVNEIQMALSRCKSNSAPGPDGIKYTVLKKLPVSFLLCIITLFNLCLKHGHFPLRWKQANGIMLPKKGKDPSLARSYHPISLLPAIGKLFKRILNARLMCHLKEINYFNLWQRAYLQKREAGEIIYKLSEEIRCGRGKNGRPWHTTVFSLDVEKAFDSVWHNGLCQKIYALGLPTKITRIIASFLRDRSVQVRVQSALSYPVSLKAGTPQGSVLSPLLYLIYVNDAPWELIMR